MSEQRADAVKNYFLKRFSLLNSELVHAYGHGENWGNLHRMAEDDSELPMREEVLHILNSNVPEDERESRLKALKGGTAYRYIYNNYYPRLRLGASLNVMLAEAAPEDLRSLVFGPTIRPLAIRRDTLQPLQIGLPAFDYTPVTPDKEEAKYIRPIAIKTNMLFDLATLFNVEVEIPIGKKFSLLGEWIFPFWGGLGNAGGVAPLPAYSEKYTLQMLSGMIEGRYWFRRSEKLDRRVQKWGDYNPLNGWFVGLFGGAGLYDGQWGKHGMQGEFYIASGISFGYAHSIAKNLHLEYSAGAGYIATRYYNYTVLDGHKVVDIREDGKYDRRQQSLIGPTRLKVSLVWIPQLKVKRK